MPQMFENLEMHAAHACNLACESCSHFSNHGHLGILSLEDAASWMAPWKHRLRPRTFSILGGEPTLNRGLTELFQLSRENWPEATIRIVTNGYYLSRHTALPRVMAEDGNALLCLSIHHGSTEYLDSLTPHADLLEQWAVSHDVKVEVYLSHTNWTRRYKGFGSRMAPFEDNDIRKSWERCPAKLCRQLFEHKIWKCSPLAYLQLQARQYNLSENWAPYTSYCPLSPDCSETELADFFEREEERYCAMCPAEPEKIALEDPRRRKLTTRRPDTVEKNASHPLLDQLRRISGRNRRSLDRA